MQFPLSWLKEYLPLSDITPQHIAQILTSLGIEVESMQPITFAFDDVVVAQVQEVSPHPNADKLRIATVFDGQEQLQIVCGATNCSKGMKTALARIGASLLLPSGEKISIKKSKLRGVESFGMLCSGQELQLADNSDGILDLPQNLEIGMPLQQIYADYIFNVSLTPNLGHCFSIQGIARELAAALNTSLLQIEPPLLRQDAQLPIETLVDVDVTEPSLCTHYSMRIIKNVQIAPSPLWLQKRLQACGLRSINNIVDVTNYILLQYGQPLHAFDYGRFEQKKVIVRSAKNEETIITLDGIERTIPTGALLICSASAPEAIAGVMGGMHSAITSDTVDVALESAIFNPSCIRKTSKLLGLATDASKRFERGVDPAQVLHVLDCAAGMIQQIAAGRIADGRVDISTQKIEPRHILCRTEKVNQLLGLNLSCAAIQDLLLRLELASGVKESNIIEVTIPTHRNDLAAEIDLIEEIARLYGYANLPRRQAKYDSSSTIASPAIFSLTRKFKNKLVGMGMQEIMSCDLISPMQAKTVAEGFQHSLVPVLNPTSQEQSILRPSLLPGLLQVIKHNTARQSEDHCGFEIGRIYSTNNNGYQEKTSAGLIVSGKKKPFHWQTKEEIFWDFFDLKGIIEGVLDTCSLPQSSFVPSAFSFLHPGRQAHIVIVQQTVGAIGEVHPDLTSNDISSQRVIFCEIELDALLPLLQPLPKMALLPQFPTSERDWTVTVSKDLTWVQIQDCITSCQSTLLENFRLKDIYCGPRSDPDKKNVTIHFVYRSLQHTLSFEEVEQQHQKITSAVYSFLQSIGQ